MAVKNNRRMAPEFTSFRSFDVNKKKKKLEHLSYSRLEIKALAILLISYS